MLEDLQDYIDDYLKTSSFVMTSKQFYEWKKCNDKQTTNEEKGKQKGKITTSTIKEKPYRKKLVEKEQWKQTWQYQRTCKSYQDAIRWAQEDWKLSIVTALRYNSAKKTFHHKSLSQKNGIDKTAEKIVNDQWLSDVYGYEIMSKLVDQASYQEFVKCPLCKKNWSQATIVTP